MSAERGTAEVVADLAHDLSRVESFRLDASLLDSPMAAVLPSGKTLHSLKKLSDEWRTAPERRVGVAHLESIESFCSHVNRFKAEATAVFATALPGKSALLEAVYDYHPETGDVRQAAFLQHRARYPLMFSREWKAWTEAEKAMMGMADFAQFLEDRVSDVYLGDAAPHLLELVSSLELSLASAGTLVRLSRNFSVNVDVKLRDVRTLSSGEISVVYDEAHRDGVGQAIKVPNAFFIAIPVFEGAPAYVMLVRLSYRVAGGVVRWGIRLHRPEAVVRDSLEQLRSVVAEQCTIPVFAGAAEV